MIFSRRPACVASGAISTQSACDKMWTNARKVVKILLGSVCAEVLGVFREAFVGGGVVGAPLVHGSVIASLDALPRCAGASPTPDIGVGRWVGLVLVSYWGGG